MRGADLGTGRLSRRTCIVHIISTQSRVQRLCRGMMDRVVVRFMRPIWILNKALHEGGKGAPQNEALAVFVRNGNEGVGGIGVSSGAYLVPITAGH